MKSSDSSKDTLQTMLVRGPVVDLKSGCRALSNLLSQRQRSSPNQTQNNAGGWVHEISDMDRLKRFLCLGAEQGTAYLQGGQLKSSNCQCILKMIKNGQDRSVYDTIKEWSIEGRVAKQDAIILALAMLCRFATDDTKKLIREEGLSPILRTSTMLFDFLTQYEAAEPSSTGWGRRHRKVICDWYLSKPAPSLRYQVTKYRQRNGWAHRDVLRLAHPKTRDSEQRTIFRWITGLGKTGENENVLEGDDETTEYLRDFRMVQRAETIDQKTLEIIRKHKFGREHLSSVCLGSRAGYQAILPHMPVTALLRNLCNLIKHGVLDDADDERMVLEKLSDESVLEKARIHPLQVLVASGALQIRAESCKKLRDCLDSSFYKCFKHAPRTGKKFMVGLDVSGSMTWTMCSQRITCMRGALALTLAILAREDNTEVMAFSNELTKLDLDPKKTLERNEAKLSNLNFSATDAALPILQALKQNISVDCFVVMTDNETWAGRAKPEDALREYRRKMKAPKTALIVIAMTSTEFSIGDPLDRYTLNLAGFDANMHATIAEFLRNI